MATVGFEPTQPVRTTDLQSALALQLQRVAINSLLEYVHIYIDYDIYKVMQNTLVSNYYSGNI